LVSQPLPGEVRLQWWTDMLAGEGRGGVEGNPVAAELLQVIQTYPLPVERLSRLVEEHQFDLYNDPMPTMLALEGYLNDTASAMFLLAAALIAPPSEATEHLARHAGLAQGMVQVVASVAFDVSQRQLFVPLQLLADHGCGIKDVFAGKETPKLRAAFDDLLAEAREHLSAAFALLAAVPPEVRTVFLPLAQIRRDLKRMSRADNDPFVPQSTSRFRILWTLWRASRTRAFSS
jgi:phytoene synthase